ncbi:MAG: hypothetical protein ACO3ST_01555 [Burkholderiaceae bacterium]
MSDVNRREERVRELEKLPNLTSQQRLELNQLYSAIDRDTNRGAQQAESGQTGTRGAMNPFKSEKKAKGGSVKSSASKRADGIVQRGKTKGRFV